MDEPKGMQQMLSEEWFTDEIKLQHYTVDGKKDAYGVLIPNTSLNFMVSNLLDFEEEESLLQSMGWRMGVIIDCTPKYHHEFAGEGMQFGVFKKWIYGEANKCKMEKLTIQRYRYSIPDKGCANNREGMKILS